MMSRNFCDHVSPRDVQSMAPIDRQQLYLFAVTSPSTEPQFKYEPMASS